MPARYCRLSSGDEVHVRSEELPYRALVAFRPEVVRVGNDPGGNRVTGVISNHVFLGELTELWVTLQDGTRLIARGHDLPAATSGEQVTVSWPVEASRLLAERD